MKSKRIVQTLCVCVFCIVLSTSAMTYEEQPDNGLDFEVPIPPKVDMQDIHRILKETKGYTEHFAQDHYFEEVLPDDVEIYGFDFPAELTEYIYCALEEERLIPALIEIETEYKVLNEQEIKKVIEKENSGLMSVSSFQYYEGSEEDQWFQVSLDEKDDIVVVYTSKYGDTRILVFDNYLGKGDSYEALCAENRQIENYPYFIRWEDKNYMAVPYWGMDSDKIKGVTVWCFSDHVYWCVGIGINNDNTRNICYQVYCIGRASSLDWIEPLGYEGGWPMVVKE